MKKRTSNILHKANQLIEMNIWIFSEQNESSDTTRMTFKSNESMSQVNELINSIAKKVDTNQVDIQTKRLFKRYEARKQQDIERKKQVGN